MKHPNPKSPEPSLPDALVSVLLEAVPPVTPPPERLEAMKQRLMERVRAERGAAEAALKQDVVPPSVIRSSEGAWVSFGPGLAMKVLKDDGETRTWLARLDPGAHLDAHFQTGDEEAYVIKGWCTVDDLVLREGDYHVIPKGNRHGDIHSPEGCLALMRSHSLMKKAADLIPARPLR